MTLELISTALTVLVNGALGSMLLAQRPRAAGARLFLAIVALVILWTLANLAIDMSSSTLAAVWWLRALYALAVGYIYLFFLFALAFGEARGSLARRLAPLVHTAMLGIILFTLGTQFIFRYVALGADGLESLSFEPLFMMSAWFLLVPIALSMLELFGKRRYAEGRSRAQLTVVIVSWSLFLGLVVVTGAILPYFIPAFVNLSKFAPLFSIIMVAGTAYTVLAHGFLDIKLVIQRSLIFSFLLAIVLGFYLLGIALLGSVLDLSGNSARLTSAVVTAAAGIIGVPFIRRWFTAYTDRLFFKDSYDYADALHELSVILNTSSDFGALVEQAQASLARILRAESVRIIFSGSDSEEFYVDDPRSVPKPKRLVIPIGGPAGKAIGVISVGEKRSGDPYTLEDIQLLETITYQAMSVLARARLYEQVRRHAEELEENVRERTQELERLREHERHMMIDISHNLQTPLAVLQTKLDQLKSGRTNDTELLGIEQSLSSLSNFIYDLLALARLENEPVGIQERFSLSALLADTAEEIGTIADASDIRVKSDIAPGITLVGDPKRIKEALMNIANNSVKYMRTKGIREIAFALESEDGTSIITVRDTGIGIAPDELGRVFERFYRGARAHKGTKGTGLGLAIAKRIIESHGGGIRAISSPDGTELTIRIPRAS